MTRSRLGVFALLGLAVATVVVTAGHQQSTVQAQARIQRPAPGQAEGATEVTSVEFTDADAGRARRLWTRNNMRTAKDMDLMPASFEQRAAMSAQAASARRGPVQLSTSGRPGDRPRQMTLPEGSDLSDGEIRPLAGNGSPGWGGISNQYPLVFTRYRLFPDTASVRNAFPNRTIGKLFFTIPGEGRFVCSASVISSNNLSVVWTAGHCVATPGIGFHTDFAFVPAFHLGGAAPFGMWTNQTAFTFTRWITEGCLELDMGALVMRQDGGGVAPAGTPIGTVTGFLGFIANLSPLQHWHVSGFPQGIQSHPGGGHSIPGPRFDGGHVELCATQAGVSGTVTCDDTGNFVIGVGCDQTGGTSGGPWVLDYTGTPDPLRNLINGHNSFRFICVEGDGPECDAAHLELELFGPYFGDAALLLKLVAEDVEPPEEDG